jgi:hypothetical protein
MKSANQVGLISKARRQYLSYQEAGRARARKGSLLHQAGCMLYWGEGTKSKNSICFLNGDPNMLLLFMRFLREELSVDDAVISLRIQCHATDPEKLEVAKIYWSHLLRLPASSVRKIMIKKGNDQVKHREHPYGFCCILVHRTVLIHHIYGAIQEYSGFDNPNWLF